MAAGIAEEHADLAVFDAAGGAGILPLHARGFVALLEKAGFVENQHGGGIIEMLAHIGLQVVADGIGIPLRPRQKVLHAIRRRITSGFGQLPAVLPLDRRQQPTQIRPRPSTRFSPRKPRRKPVTHVGNRLSEGRHLRCYRHALSPPDTHNAETRL